MPNIEVMTKYVLSQSMRRSFPLLDSPSFDQSVSVPTSYIEWCELIERSSLCRALKISKVSLAEYAYRQFALQTSRGIRTVWLGEADYPLRLAQIPDPPLALNIMGGPLNLADCVAVVGARKALPFALHQSFAVARVLAQQNIVVVSGGAYGCDIAAHHGVLSTCLDPCPAVVVMAGGLAEFYPKGNHQIFHDVLEQNGMICSENLYEYKPRPYDFLHRNRIIAGLSELTILIQAGSSSGALKTVQLALDYGRTVHVLLHEGLGESFHGNIKLLMDGALGFADAESFARQEFVGCKLIEDHERQLFGM